MVKPRLLWFRKLRDETILRFGFYAIRSLVYGLYGRTGSECGVWGHLFGLSLALRVFYINIEMLFDFWQMALFIKSYRLRLTLTHRYCCDLTFSTTVTGRTLLLQTDDVLNCIPTST